METSGLENTKATLKKTFGQQADVLPSRHSMLSQRHLRSLLSMCHSRFSLHLASDADALRDRTSKHGAVKMPLMYHANLLTFMVSTDAIN
eukprot:344517-Chlamydomonas_euryale.AAC.7